LLFLIRGLRRKEGGTKVQSFDVLWVLAFVIRCDLARLQAEDYEDVLQSDNPVNAVRPEDAELALVIATKVNQTTTTPASAGQRHLVDRTDALPVLVFEQHDRLTRHRCRQA
jgi:hypothetical protein